MKKQDFSKKILKILSEKKAIPLTELSHLEVKPPSGEKKEKYAVNRSIKGLREAGLIEEITSPQQSYIRLTKEGKKKAHSLKLESETTLVNPTWDGYWRIILLDLPEERKSERESLRYLLKKAGFVCLKNSAWISPYPFEHLFTNIKKDLGLTTEMMIIVTQFIDDETRKVLFQAFGE